MGRFFTCLGGCVCFVANGTSSDFLESYFLLSYNTYCGFIDIVFLVMLLEHLQHYSKKMSSDVFMIYLTFYAHKYFPHFREQDQYFNLRDLHLSTFTISENKGPNSLLVTLRLFKLLYGLHISIETQK